MACTGPPKVIEYNEYECAERTVRRSVDERDVRASVVYMYYFSLQTISYHIVGRPNTARMANIDFFFHKLENQKTIT